jgi:hypothetical protein
MVDRHFLLKRRALARCVLALYVLLGIASPVAHAQLDRGRKTTPHVETQKAACPDHDPLSCSSCRIGTLPATPAADVSIPDVGEGTILAVPWLATVRAVPAVHSPLGARAPPLR